MRALPLAVFILMVGQVFAQKKQLQITQYSVEAGAYYSPVGNVPFWLRANQYGVVPRESPVGYLRAVLKTDYRPSGYPRRKPLAVGYGIDAIVNAYGPGKSVQIILPEAYVKVRLWPLELWAGRRKEVYGLVDTLLTSGSYAWSGNALPLPKVQLSIPEFWPANSPISIKGTYSHGYFENSRAYTRNVMLHQKSFYMRFGKANNLLNFYAGFNHQVQWGGYSPYNSTEGKLPSSWEAYKYVVTGKSVAGDSLKFGNSMDGGNRVGNHLGSIDAAVEINTSKFSILLYRQNLYEDGTLYYGTNIADGLNGIRWVNRVPSAYGFHLERLTAEFLYTKSQGGDEFTIDPQKRGRDNYFNHNQYLDGWSYFGRTIGTPFIMPNIDLRDGLVPTSGFTSNNRVQVVHMGAAASIDKTVRLEAKVSYSWNEGTYDMALPNLTQLSSYLRCTAPLGRLAGTEISGAIAYDKGSLMNDALGFNLSLRKTWNNRARLLAKATEKEKSPASPHAVASSAASTPPLKEPRTRLSGRPRGDRL